MNDTMKKAIEAQINRELYSAYLYLNFSSALSDLGLPGFANWMRVQFHEEQAHAMHMFDYLLERCDGGVRLEAIDAPKDTPATALEAMELTLKHEKFVTANISALATLAMKEGDHAAYNFMQWYVNEQVEEEANAKALIQKLKLIGDNTSMLLTVDAELAARVFVDPFAAAGTP